MKRLMTRLALIGGWTTATLAGAGAQEPGFVGPLNDSMDRMFRQWATETPEERRRLEAIEISEAEEKRIGAERLEWLRRDLENRRLALLTEGTDVDYLRSLVKRLLPHLRHRNRYRDIQLYVVTSDDTEAGSLPGGYIVVTRGLLEFAPSEAAMVGVLAHELAHIDRAHQLDDVRRMKSMEQALQSGVSGPQDFATIGMSFAKRFARPFRPEQETEADSDATLWTWQAGYDPRQMADLFDRLHERDRSRGNVPAPSFLRSHPYHWERSQAIRQETDALIKRQRRRKLYVGRTNLVRRIPRSEQSFAE